MPKTEPLAGAAEIDVSPTDSQFLYGYPHVKRYSRGVHDPLLASALCMFDGRAAAIFIACDVIWVPRPVVQRARRRIASLTGVAPERVMITATHTHSGPITAPMLVAEADPAIPEPDPGYVARLEAGIVRAAAQAWRALRPASFAFATADAAGLGTNRRDPAGPSDPRIPILVARDAGSNAPIAVMAVCRMHPTVLHEDWTLVSGDFPGLARQWLRTNAPGLNCPFVYHMGAAGNQSPRHAVKANTIDEAQRLGAILGQAVAGAVDRAEPLAACDVRSEHAVVDLPVRTMPSVADAQRRLDTVKNRLDRLRAEQAPRTEVRTAECDWFGAEETLTLARGAADGRLNTFAAACLPAEVQAIAIGEHTFIGWPGEVFVEFSLDVSARHPNAHVITLANGDLQGYLVTQAAVDEGGYEASNAIFASPEGGRRLVDATLSLLQRLGVPEEATCRAS